MSDDRYFRRLESDLEAARDVAERARAQGRDPEPEVEIPQARDMADRVEKVLGIDGVAERIRELEGDHSREEAALAMVEDFVEGTVGDYDTDAAKIEGAVRTAVALLTEGVVAAPIEGIDLVELLDNDDGTQFVNVYYAGPIRSAGGTAQALSVLVADYARSLLGLSEYDARTEEVDRYAEEVTLYDDETGLQYSPSDEETTFIARHMPIMLDGEATSDGEVSGTRDIERVETNGARGGMCLVLAEGIALKAPKIQRYTRELDEVDWPWLQDLIDGTIGEGDGSEDEDADEGEAPGDEDGADDGTGEDDDEGHDEPAGPPRAEPHEKYLRDLIAGRPVFSHPSESGGFRLRLGRARNHGHATAGIHPATMHLVDDFLATGTQIKTELPGKAAGIVPVDSIEGPTVRLANGDVRRIDDAGEARAVRNGVEAILDVGEYLVNYGEFVENNHDLVPASYTVEWWVQELERTDANVQAMRDSPRVDLDDPDPTEAIEWAREYDAPLHPAYTYLWHDVEPDEFEHLAGAVAAGHVREDGTLVVPDDDATRRSLEGLLVEHTQGVDPAEALPDRGTVPDDWIVRNGHGGATDGDDRGKATGNGTGGTGEDTAIVVPTWRPLAVCLGLDPDGGLERTWEDVPDEAREWPNAVKAVNAVAPVTVRERAPTRVGNRMGRPEKSESRELSPAVHALFPIGEAGGAQRDVAAAADHQPHRGATPGRVEVEVGHRRCRDCDGETFKSRCPDCGGHTDPHYTCPECGQVVDPDESGRVHCSRCDVEATAVEPREVDVDAEYRSALQAVGERENAFDILKGVKGLTSTVKTPEPLAKGVLRSKHGVSAFKDGTVRYDITDLPVTAVRPEELDVSAQQLRELGYETDLRGEPLRHDDQLVELKIQDVVLSEGAADHMLDTADFVDDLLESFYGLDPFYEVEDREDLVGELVFGMAPHTSAATVARVVGFTTAAAGYAHPYFHAAKRRNCDGDEDCVMLLMDGLLNFSKSYLPDQRGGSVAEDSNLVAFDPDGQLRFLSFEELWEELDAEVERDGKFRKKTCRSEGWRTYAFDDDHRAEPKPIEKAIRYPAAENEQLLRVETQFGRSVEITTDHSLFRYDDGIEEVAGSDLAEGDLIAAPQSLDVDPVGTTIDAAECFDDPYVFIDDRVEDLLRTVWESTDRGSETHAAFRSGLSYRLSKRKIRFDRLERILETAPGFSAVPKDVTIGSKGSETGIDRVIELDEEFAWLLGMFVAEGTLSSINPCIHNGDEDLVERAVKVARSTLGIEPETRWSNRAYEVRFPAVFEHVLYDLGFAERDSYSSSEKVIPDAILRADRNIVLAFMEGFIAGDGSESSDDNATTIGFHTTSPDVKDGLVFLLHRLGLVANVSERERDEPRQPIFTVTVSGGANDNPLRRILDGERPYQPKSLVVTIPEALMEIREMGIEGVKQVIPKYLLRRENVSLEKLREMVTELEERELPTAAEEKLAEIRPLLDGDLSYLRVENVERVDYDGFLYDLQVGGDPVFTADWLYAHNSMDAPLVMSSRIDPAEIDDEAHNVDIVEQYPLELYEASRELAHPEDVDVEIAEDRLGTDRETEGFGHTHDTTAIAAGPDLSAYKTLEDMHDKMDGQLELARKIRAVDETDVAERVIEYHFLPDLIGNLRAFSRQEVRCLDCGTKYRRPPLTGECRECGGDVTLTVHEGSVTKYLETATRIAEEYGAREYTKQRLEVLEMSIESIFENDKNKQSGIADFM